MTNTFVNSPQIAIADSNTPYTTSVITGATGYGAGDYVAGNPRIVRSRIADSGQLGVAATQATSVVNRLMRVRDDIIVSKLEAWIDAPTGTTVTTATFNFGLYYSDRPGDIPASLANYGISPAVAISDSFFAYHVDLHAQTTPLDITLNNASGNSATDGYYTPGALEYPLWDAVMNGGSDRILTTTPPTGFYTQGKGYSSGSTAQWTLPANGGTVLPVGPSGTYQPGAPGTLVDICARPSSAVSSTGPITLFIRLTYLTPAAP